MPLSEKMDPVVVVVADARVDAAAADDVEAAEVVEVDDVDAAVLLVAAEDDAAGRDAVLRFGRSVSDVCAAAIPATKKTMPP